MGWKYSQHSQSVSRSVRRAQWLLRQRVHNDSVVLSIVMCVQDQPVVVHVILSVAAGIKAKNSFKTDSEEPGRDALVF